MGWEFEKKVMFGSHRVRITTPAGKIHEYIVRPRTGFTYNAKEHFEYAKLVGKQKLYSKGIPKGSRLEIL